MIYKRNWNDLYFYFSVFSFLFNGFFYVVFDLDIGLLRVIDAEVGSDSDGEYYEDTYIKEPPLSPGVIEKIFNSKGIKIRENHYDFVLIDGIQKKRIAKTFYYNKRGSVVKAVAFNGSEVLAIYDKNEHNKYS